MTTSKRRQALLTTSGEKPRWWTLFEKDCRWWYRVGKQGSPGNKSWLVTLGRACASQHCLASR